MVQRTDTIFQDEISESFGGSFYHNFSLTVYDSATDLDTSQQVGWIAPRNVRIINNRLLSTVLAVQTGAGEDNTIAVFKDVGASTDRAVITAVGSDDKAVDGSPDLTVDVVDTPTLSTASADDTGFPALPHVVCPQYGFYKLIHTIDAASTGPFNYTYMAHYSFEDL